MPASTGYRNSTNLRPESPNVRPSWQKTTRPVRPLCRKPSLHVSMWMNTWPTITPSSKVTFLIFLRGLNREILLWAIDSASKDNCHWPVNPGAHRHWAKRCWSTQVAPSAHPCPRHQSTTETHTMLSKTSKTYWHIILWSIHAVLSYQQGWPTPDCLKQTQCFQWLATYTETYSRRKWDSSVGRLPDSPSKSCKFKSRRREFSFTELTFRTDSYSVPVPPLCYCSST